MTDATGELALRLGWDVDDFAGVFGATWRFDAEAPVLHDFDADPSGGGGLPLGGWYVAGSPPQLMMRLSPWVGIFLARPEGTWVGGTHDLRYSPVDEVYVSDTSPGDREHVEVAVRRLLTARRRTFRYCRYCWEATPPESRFSSDCCQSCATRWLRVVY